MIQTYADIEWARLVSEAKRNLESKCPLLEDEVMVYMDERMKRLEKEADSMKSERDKYRAIALRLIRVYCVDDYAWAPDEESEKILDEEAEKMLEKEAGL